MHEWPWPMALIIARVKEMWLLPLPPGRMQIERVVVLPILPIGSAMLTGWPDGTATFNRTAAQRLLIRIYMPWRPAMQVVEQQRALSWPGGLAPTEHGGGLNAPKCFQAAGTPNEFPPVQAQAGPRDEQCRAAHMGILSDPRNHHPHHHRLLARSRWHFSPPIPAASLRVTGPQVHARASDDHAATKRLRYSGQRAGGYRNSGFRKRIAADRERGFSSRVVACVDRIASRLLIEIQAELFLDGLYRGLKKLDVSASTALTSCALASIHQAGDQGTWIRAHARCDTRKDEETGSPPARGLGRPERTRAFRNCNVKLRWTQRVYVRRPCVLRCYLPCSCDPIAISAWCCIFSNYSVRCAVASGWC